MVTCLEVTERSGMKYTVPVDPEREEKIMLNQCHAQGGYWRTDLTTAAPVFVPWHEIVKITIVEKEWNEGTV